MHRQRVVWAVFVAFGLAAVFSTGVAQENITPASETQGSELVELAAGDIESSVKNTAVGATVRGVKQMKLKQLKTAERRHKKASQRLKKASKRHKKASTRLLAQFKASRIAEEPDAATKEPAAKSKLASESLKKPTRKGFLHPSRKGFRRPEDQRRELQGLDVAAFKASGLGEVGKAHEGRRGGGALMTSGSFTMMSANRAGNSEDDEEELGGGQSTGDTMHDRSELPAPEDEEELGSGKRAAVLSRFLAKALAATTTAKNAASKATSKGTNLALKRPAALSTTAYYCSASRAVDGDTRSSFPHLAHTNPEDDPWFQITLDQSTQVDTLRVLNRGDYCGGRLDGFTLLVDGKSCAKGLMVPQGLAGDFKCGLKGQKVKILLPGKKRILQLPEVEVYGPASSSQGCYKKVGHRYENMESCAACSGPGPSQCTKCADTHALIAWRNKGKEGSCHTYSDAMKAIAMPGIFVPDAHTKEAFYTKWGRVEASAMISIPASTESGESLFTAQPVCDQYKLVVCQPRTSMTAPQRCDVTMTTRLAYMNKINIDKKPWAKAQCSKAGGSLEGHFCNGVSAIQFASWVALQSVHEVCDQFLKLL